MQIDLELYRFFYHTAKTGSLSKAAQELFVTQSAISQSIKLLEQHLGVQLFYRSPQGVTLTEEGQRLYPPVEHAYRLLIDAQKEMIDRREALSGEIRIGASDALGKHILLPRLRMFRAAHPDVRIKLVHRTTLQTIRLLQEGKIEVGLVYLPVETKRLTVEEVAIIHDCFVAAPGFLPDLEESLSPAQLIQYPFLMLGKASHSRQWVDAFFDQYGMKMNPEMELASLELLIEFCMAGFGVASVAREFVVAELERGLLVEIPVSQPLPRRGVGLVVPSDRAPSRNVRQLMSYFV
jgi:LysR family cyn operon transcriptional activator